jgi:hypothetical protein
VEEICWLLRVLGQAQLWKAGRGDKIFVLLRGAVPLFIHDSTSHTQCSITKTRQQSLTSLFTLIPLAKLLFQIFSPTGLGQFYPLPLNFIAVTGRTLSTTWHNWRSSSSVSLHHPNEQIRYPEDGGCMCVWNIWMLNHDHGAETQRLSLDQQILWKSENLNNFHGSTVN